MTDVYIDPLYKICLSCPLPRCVDESPCCPRRHAERVSSIPDGHLTIEQLMIMLDLKRPQVTEYLKNLSSVGAYKLRIGNVGQARWIVPEAGARWLARYVEANGRK